jgi:pimeloyl-ACP methyl ester carboxylesterase
MRRWLARAAKVLAAIAAVAAVVFGVWWFVPAGTQPIEGEHAIAELREIELGGFPQAVLLRGVDRRNPVLLYVHGGPGSAQLPVARHYSDELERHFVVAHWDQRGAGASCDGVDWGTVTLEQIVADAIELAEKLGNGQQIVLLGHSWGSLVGALAVQRRPGLFLAYVGTGQLVHRDRQEQLSYDWVVEQARDAGDEQALAELATIHPPYTTQAEFKLQRGWLSEYRGEVYDTDEARKMLPAAIFGREYTLATKLHYAGCFRKSLDTLLQDRLGIDLFTRIPKLDVPVFLFTGRHDENTSWSLVEEWARQLHAPQVEMVWFEDAGHFLAIEAPDEFQARLVEKLSPLLPKPER